MRDPKDIQEEVLKKKLKTLHPFKGDLVSNVRQNLINIFGKCFFVSLYYFRIIIKSISCKTNLNHNPYAFVMPDTNMY